MPHLALDLLARRKFHFLFHNRIITASAQNKKFLISLLVPKEGLEPSRVASHVPETCASTNFATSA